MTTTQDNSETRIGPYLLRERLGVGGMGEVFLAIGPGGAEVALKRIRLDLGEHEGLRRRLIREARAFANLSHPNITRLLDFGESEGTYYLVTELVRGGSLADWRQEPPDGETIADVFEQILTALMYAHARGIVHRDLKPENVLLQRSADHRIVAKVTDFGVAHFRDNDEEVDSEAAVIGTPAYMSPEQALHTSDPSPASDLYTVGVMIYELLCGRLPYGARSVAALMIAHRNEPIPALELRPGFQVSSEADAILKRFLAKDPLDRFHFAVDARSAIAALQLSGSARSGVQVGAGANENWTPVPTAVGITVIRGQRAQETEAAAPRNLFGLREVPFAGREDELTQLVQSARRCVVTGRLGVMLIGGEQGIGKSTLVTKLREFVDENGRMQTWWGSYDGGRDLGPSGLRQAIRRGLGVSQLSPAQTEARVEQILKKQGAFDPREARAMMEFLEPSHVSGEDRVMLKTETATWALVRRILQRASRVRPVLLVLEDVHLSDGDGVRFLEWLIDVPERDAPCLVVATYDPVETPSAASVSRAVERLARYESSGAFSQLRLRRMGLRAIRELVTGCAPIDGEVADVVALRAGGNPLYAVELVRHLVETGKYQAAGAEAAEALLRDLPDRVASVLLNRLEQSSATRSAWLPVWEQLSFFGLRFSQELALAASKLGGAPKKSVTEALAGALTLNVLIEEDRGIFRFENALVREALMERARDGGRQQAHHLLAARARIASAGHRLDAASADIARSFEHAGAMSEAVDFYRRAANFARKSRRYRDAVDLLERADAGLDQAGPNDELRIDLVLEMGRVRLLLGEMDRAEECCIQARRYAQFSRSPSPPASTWLLAEVAAVRGDIRQSRSLFEAAVIAFQREGEEASSIGPKFGLARLDLADGRLSDAEHRLRDVAIMAHKAGDTATEAEAYLALGNVAFLTGLNDEAKTFAQEARARFEDSDDRVGTAQAMVLAGEVAAAERSPGAAAELFERARVELIAAGEWRSAAVATIALAETARTENRAETARERIASAIAVLKVIGDQRNLAIAHLVAASIDAELGAWDRALPAIEDAIARDDEERIDDMRFVNSLIDVAKMSLMGGHRTIARKLLDVASYKLGRVAAGSPLYDRVDEVQYLRAELATETGSKNELDEPTAVVDFLDD